MERRVHTYEHWLRVLFCGLAVCGFARSTAAFTMSDGSIVTCRSYSGRQVDEVIQSSFSAAFTTGGFTGVTVTLPDGSARITWDSGRLNALPREAHDYIYFHECAHAHGQVVSELSLVLRRGAARGPGNLLCPSAPDPGALQLHRRVFGRRPCDCVVPIVNERRQGPEHVRGPRRRDSSRRWHVLGHR